MSSFQATSSLPFAGLDPSLAMAALIEAQHKNAAALGDANQATVDGLKTLVQRQSFLFTASVDTYTRATSDLLAARSFEERAAKQADATRDACISIIARFHELSDILIETNVTAMGIVNARIVEAFGEWKALFAPPVAASPVPSEAPPASVAEPVVAREEVDATEKTILPIERDPATAAAAPTPAPEATASETVITVIPAALPSERVAQESRADAAPTRPARKAAPAAKAATVPARAVAPKTSPTRPPRRPTPRT